MTAGQKAYRVFLKSPFWKSMSKKKRARAGKCKTCGSTSRLQAHHIRYRKDWYETKMRDLVVLCNGCHKFEHGLGPDPVFAARFWFSQDISDMTKNRLLKGKPLTRSNLKKLRHIAEMYSDNAGMMLQFKRAMWRHDCVVRARSFGLIGNAALECALDLELSPH